MRKILTLSTLALLVANTASASSKGQDVAVTNGAPQSGVMLTLTAPSPTTATPAAPTAAVSTAAPAAVSKQSKLSKCWSCFKADTEIAFTDLEAILQAAPGAIKIATTDVETTLKTLTALIKTGQQDIVAIQAAAQGVSDAANGLKNTICPPTAADKSK